ncbi:MAG: hypothetical protein ACP5JU_03655 [Minisyncoccia bacterium]
MNIFKRDEEKIIPFYSSFETENILNCIKEIMNWTDYTNVNILKTIFDHFIGDTRMRSNYRNHIFWFSI